MANAPVNNFSKYHAHIYFDATTETLARRLCVSTWQECHVGLGRFHRKPIGPHPEWSCQVSFDSKEFDNVIHWLKQHREHLSVLVHPLTGDPLAEHSEHASWLGDPIDLKLDVFETPSAKD